MTVEQFLRDHRPDEATAVQALAYQAVAALQEIHVRLKAAIEITESDVLRVQRKIVQGRDLADLCLNTAGEIQSVTTLNMAVAEFMTQREAVRTLLEAVEKERSGKREWWKGSR